MTGWVLHPLWPPHPPSVPPLLMIQERSQCSDWQVPSGAGRESHSLRAPGLSWHQAARYLLISKCWEFGTVLLCGAFWSTVLKTTFFFFLNVVCDMSHVINKCANQCYSSCQILHSGRTHWNNNTIVSAAMVSSIPFTVIIHLYMCDSTKLLTIRMLFFLIATDQMWGTNNNFTSLCS